MGEIVLNLVVIRSGDVERLVEFYGSIGVDMVKHRHGDGEEHHAFDSGGVVFEIYPQREDADSTSGVRLGFRVPSVVRAVEMAVAAGGSLVSKPRQSDWGLRAVVTDPDGHKVELTELAVVDEP